ncbi:MAG: hypothetical protein Q6370_009620 [Candidatus Sigynarchaeota archaeon]
MDTFHEETNMKITTSSQAKEYIENEEKKRGKQCVIAIAESQYRS